jgi:hypothetical protein
MRKSCPMIRALIAGPFLLLIALPETPETMTGACRRAGSVGAGKQEAVE